MIIDLLSRLIPDAIRKDEEMLMRSYVMVGIMLANSTISFLGVIVFLFFVKLPPDIAWIGMSFVGGGLFGYVLIMLMFYWTGNYVIASNSVIFILMLMIYTAIPITGGFATSVMVQLCFLSPSLAFLLTGLRAGSIWLLLTCILSAISLITSRMGIGYVSLLPAEYSSLMGTVLHFVLFFMVGGAILLYEVINNFLKDKLKAEKDKYKNIASVATDSSVVIKSADALALSADSVLESSVQQKSAIEELVITTEHLNATAQRNSALADSAKNAIKDAGVYIGDSKQDIHKLLETMNQVKASSAEIQNINNVINEISKQTNLLSLNAMIEASRSSEQSGGFKVVAMEVRHLAEKSAIAARDINALLESNLVSVREGLALTELMHQRFEELTARIDPVIVSTQDISDASFEQSESIQEIAHALTDIDRAVNENQVAAEETSNLAAELRGNAQKLMALVEGL